MTYYVKEEKNNYYIVEKGTELVLQETTDRAFARSRCRTLNLGSGFNGFTPEFFCAKYPNIQESIPN
jgi:hypothetical protein